MLALKAIKNCIYNSFYEKDEKENKEFHKNWKK